MEYPRKITTIIFCLVTSLLIGCSSGGGLTAESRPPTSLPTPTPAVTPAPTPLNCPSGFVLVPGDAVLGTTNFCVAQYEMRDVGGQAVSQAASPPWSGASRNVALAACQAMGAHYDLISNAEWQTMARNIALQAVNWSSGIVGTGVLNVGNGDGSGNGSACDSTSEYVDVSCTPLASAGNFQFKRTHVLSNANIVWDVGANNYEIVKDLSTAGQYGVTGCPSDFTAINPANDALGTAKNAFGLASNAGFNLTGCGNLGYFAGATSDNSVVQRAVLRGGAFYDPSGIFSADIGWATTTDTDGSYSFRCSYK